MNQAIVAVVLTAALAACQGEEPAGAADAQDSTRIAGTTAAEASAAHPPLGRYVCRQYMTTIGWIDLSEDAYAVRDVRGGYSFDPASGAIEWDGGAYAGWPARYEFSPAGEGHAHDEDIIRMTDEGGELKIDCFLTED